MEDEKAPAAPPATKGPSQMKLVIAGALALFVALVAAQVAVPLINGFIAGAGHGGVAADEDGEAPAEEEEAIEEDAEDDVPLEPALYTALDPPFVVSYDSDGGPRYLQLTLQAMARNQKTIDAVKQHAPAIRNSVLFKLSGYEIDVLGTQAGKEQLRKDLLAAANDILAKNGAKQPIEELYFTSIVIQ